jgi:chitinase
MKSRAAILSLCLVLAFLVASGATAQAAEWAPNVAYSVGNLVTYQGPTYKCLQSHTSLVGWEPPNAPALWQLQSGTPAPTPTATSRPTATPTQGATATPTSRPTATPTSTGTTYVEVTPGAGSVTASANDGNLPGNTVDNSLATRWSANGDGQWIKYDLGTTRTLGYVKIAVYSGNARQARFDLQVSTDNAAWTNVITAGLSSGTTTQEQMFDFTDRSARYVRYLGHGNTVNAWNSLYEVSLFATGTGSTPTATPTSSPTRTATPTATPTTPPTPTPTPCTSCGSLPANLITGYWHNFNNGSTTMKLNAVPTKYGLIAVAFADTGSSPGAVTFNLDPATGYTDVNEFKSHIASINNSGRKVIISVGGQNGTVSINDSTSANNFASSVVGLMNTYGFAGVDIDLENGINATFMGQALRSIKSQKSGAIITMAPQTIDMQPGQSSGNGYFRLALNIKDILTVVNMQYYNSGSMLGCDGQVYSQGGVNFLTALACVQLQAGLAPSQVGLGVPASPSGAGSGYVSPTIVNNAMRCLESRTSCGTFVPPQAWPGIRGAMTWSINWDAVQSYSWVNGISVP